MANGAPIAQYVESFLFQSYFSGGDGAGAILDSPPNEVIIPSTRKTVDVGGYGVALDPASETPVAVEFIAQGIGVAGALVLKPGQTVRPGFPFTGLRWGLPKGWLGGGLAVLNVLRAPDADVRYVGQARPVIFHRTRLIIEDDATPLPALKLNWPSRFPWTQAMRLGTISQKSGPVLSVRPERIVCRLNANDATTPRTFRFVFRSSFDFDLDSTGVMNTGDEDAVWYDVTFPMNLSLSSSRPAVELPREFAGLTLDEGGVTVLNISGEPAFTGSSIDVVRYGSLG